MKLNRKSITSILSANLLSIPSDTIFQLPEKVLQFGTGILLRGLPDYYIDKANKEGIFNGRVVVVKSTKGNTSEFAEQDGLYTHCIKGMENSVLKEEYIINASISRVLSSETEWTEILECAANESLQIIISNTTEVGITLVETDNINNEPPVSFPGKLLSFLYRRYLEFKGTIESGMVIVPTELIVDNGTKLKSIVVELAKLNKLEESFIEWLHNANDFCNSLVDRIVPGSLPANDLKELEQNFGYADELAIMSEVYSLWAIETQSEKTKEILSFSLADKSCVITNDINKFRELKLRLLNGTHTFSCGLAYLSNFDFVNESMHHEGMKSFIHDLMMQEIAPCIISESITEEEARIFAESVINRFSNPYIQHKWLSITMQYTGKMKMRNVPLLLKYYELKGHVPKFMAMGFAAYLLFLRVTEKVDDQYYGIRNGEPYLINDDAAAYFYQLWQENDASQVAQKTLENKSLWGEDLAALPGFVEVVTNFLVPYAGNNTIISWGR